VSELLAFHIVITGRVQGVGFRPFVSRLAHEFGLAGWVLNRSGQVEIWVEGSCEALTVFKAHCLTSASACPAGMSSDFLSGPLRTLWLYH